MRICLIQTASFLGTRFSQFCWLPKRWQMLVMRDLPRAHRGRAMLYLSLDMNNDLFVSVLHNLVMSMWQEHNGNLQKCTTVSYDWDSRHTCVGMIRISIDVDMCILYMMSITGTRPMVWILTLDNFTDIIQNSLTCNYLNIVSVAAKKTRKTWISKS